MSRPGALSSRRLDHRSESEREEEAMLVAIVGRQRAGTKSAKSAAAGDVVVKQDGPESGYAAAFARVRLVRAWVGVAAATVALCYAFAKLLDHLVP
jgi:hypothetical protein